MNSFYDQAKHLAVNDLGYSAPDNSLYRVSLEDITDAVMLGIRKGIELATNGKSNPVVTSMIIQFPTMDAGAFEGIREVLRKYVAEHEQLDVLYVSSDARRSNVVICVNCDDQDVEYEIVRTFALSLSPDAVVSFV